MTRRDWTVIAASLACAAIVALVACATWTPPQAADASAQSQCALVDAGSNDMATVNAAIDACRCAVRAQYPSGPQCLPDGGLSQ